MSIISLLGIDPDSFTWHDLALCKGLDDPDDLYENYERKVNVAKAVDDMCLSCPVMKECAMTGRDSGETGVWGAVYWDGSGRPDEDKNSHKTPEIWEKIWKRLSA